MTRRAVWIGTALLGLAAAGCSNEGPRAGQLAVRLATPRTGDRAVQFTVIGRQTAVSAPSGTAYQVFSTLSVDGDTSHVVVVAPIGSGVAAGPVALISVPDLSKIGSYVGKLVDVADAAYAVDDTAGVSLSFGHP
jgi:hypothetical protein